MPERAPDLCHELCTLCQAVLLYRLSALHLDPVVARQAGFGRPILHGMATMGFAAHAVLKSILQYDDAAFAAMP